MKIFEKNKGKPKKNASRKVSETTEDLSFDDVTVSIAPDQTPIINTAMATHIGTRSDQQDSAYVCEPLFEDGIAYGILCDGMGGTAEGERAGSEVVAFMANQIASLKQNENIPDFLERNAIYANDYILEQNQKLGQGSGTTLLTAIINGDSLYWLSVGDSRIYIIRNSEIEQVTKDHNLYLELMERVNKGEITQEQADSNPKKEHLVSYIGAPFLQYIDVNIHPFKLEYGDIILLCSDGLTKALSTDKILEIVKNYEYHISEGARMLPLSAYEQSPNSLDNTTVALLQYLRNDK